MDSSSTTGAAAVRGGLGQPARGQGHNAVELLGPRNGQALGHQFAEDQGEEGDQGHGDAYANSLRVAAG